MSKPLATGPASAFRHPWLLLGWPLLVAKPGKPWGDRALVALWHHEPWYLILSEQVGPLVPLLTTGGSVLLT